MGHIEIEITISNIEGTKSTKTKALIDTGATFTIIPEKLARELEIKPTGEKIKVITAKGQDKLELAHALIEIYGKKRITPILISKHIDKVLIGIITLEAAQLKVNPITGKLEEHTALLYQTEGAKII